MGYKLKIDADVVSVYFYGLFKNNTIFMAQNPKDGCTEPVFLNVYGAPESIPRNEFRQPM